MNKTVRIWFENLYKNAINESKETIKNEQIWELGYDGEEPNPHTENIKKLREYIWLCEEKLEELKGGTNMYLVTVAKDKYRYLVTVVKNRYYSECAVEIVGLFSTKKKAYIAKEKIENLLKSEEYDNYEVFVKEYNKSNLDIITCYELEDKI